MLPPMCAEASPESDGCRILFCKTINEEFGRIDLLVNSAFWGPPGSLERTDEEFWDRTLDTTLKGPYLCTRAVVPAMLEHALA